MSDITDLSSTTITDFIRDQRILSTDPVVIDFTQISFIGPGAIVLLTSLCFHLSAEGRTILIKGGDQRLRSYLVRSGFYQTVEDIVKFEPVIPRTRLGDYEMYQGSNALLIEITRLENSYDLRGMLDKTVNTLCFRMQYQRNDALDAAIAISEVCQNTFDHNGGTCGFFSLQTFGEGVNRWTEIGISDHGVGLAQTLRENPDNPDFKSDKEAIKIAMRRGVSQYNDLTRGTGLYHLFEIVSKHKGSVRIYSGTGKLICRTDKDQQWAFDSNYLPGVTIILTFPKK